ncbi:hypothetical protein BpHYR1_000765 [Brachionus plicatilis]|uniref:Uncharacterized protein n=1 Tax=Brachionus plicatilis TaxID=10195 RepID=A0A3M7RTZ2_BRAPC|nr:hypothetical protein BpHYR1_000765 [Brachionus plicatilis]
MVIRILKNWGSNKNLSNKFFNDRIVSRRHCFDYICLIADLFLIAALDQCSNEIYNIIKD